MPTLRGTPRPNAKSFPKGRLLPQLSQVWLRLLVKTKGKCGAREVSLAIGKGWELEIATVKGTTSYVTTRGALDQRGMLVVNLP